MSNKRELAKIAREIKELKSKLAVQDNLLPDEVQKRIAGIMFGETASGVKGSAKYYMGQAQSPGPNYVSNIAQAGFNAGIMQGLAAAFSTLENLGLVNKNSRSSKEGQEARAMLAKLETIPNYAESLMKMEEEMAELKSAISVLAGDVDDMFYNLSRKEGDTICLTQKEVDDLVGRLYTLSK